MRKVTFYLFFAASAVFLLYACTKSGSSTTIIGNWVNRFDFGGNERTEAVSFVVGDTAYVGTGYNSSLTTDTLYFANNGRFYDFWKYSVDNNSWTQISSLPDSAARTSAAGFGTSTKGYISTGLGIDGITRLKDTWEYTPTTNKWAKKADFPGTPRYDAVGFSISDKGYIATGYDGGGAKKDVYMFDPVANSWTHKSDFGGSKRKQAVAFVYSGNAYIVTGIDNGTAQSDFWMYTPGTDSWTQKRAIANVSTDNYDDNYNIIRANAVSFVMGTKAYVATGENGSLFKSCWEYDFASDLWTQKTDFEGNNRTGAVAFAVKSRGFVTTGNVSTAQYSDFWEFHPNEEYNQYD